MIPSSSLPVLAENDDVPSARKEQALYIAASVACTAIPFLLAVLAVSGLGTSKEPLPAAEFVQREAPAAQSATEPVKYGCRRVRAPEIADERPD